MNYRDVQVDSFNAQKKRIKQEYFQANVAKNVAEGTKYLTISLAKEHIASYMLIEGDSLPSDYVGYGVNLNTNVLVQTKIKEYHVGIKTRPEEYYEYNNLTALLRSLAEDDSNKIIYLHGGVYDIFEEYGGESFINTLDGTEGWRNVSVFVPNNTKIIGLGNVVLKFEPTAEQIKSDTLARYFSCLNVTGNFYLENVTIKGKNCRYCVHDEISDGISTGTTHVYKNVRMYREQGTYGDPQAFGCGFSDNMEYEFENCEFISWSIPFSMHNTDTTTQKNRSVINIKNSYFQSTISSVSISFRNSSTIQVEHIVNIYDSFVGGQWANLELTAMGNTQNVNCFNVTMIGCNSIRTQVVVTPENIYPIKQINSVNTVVTVDTNRINMLSMFNKIVCCGDSLTYGLVYLSNSEYRQAVTPIDVTLGKIGNIQHERIATAGYTAKNWWDNYGERLTENALYIIMLGENGGLTPTVLEDCPGTDISQYSDTNTGCYGKILQSIKSNGFTAVMVAPPVPKNGDTSKYNNIVSALEQFSEKFTFPYITLPNLKSDIFHYAPRNKSYINNVHYNDFGYSYIGNCIAAQINNLSNEQLFDIAPI